MNEFSSGRSNWFPLELISTDKRGNNENGRFVSLENVPIYFNSWGDANREFFVQILRVEIKINWIHPAVLQ